MHRNRVAAQRWKMLRRFLSNERRAGRWNYEIISTRSGKRIVPVGFHKWHFKSVQKKNNIFRWQLFSVYRAKRAGYSPQLTDD